ncbi:MAG: hypothetical protein IPK67_20625 [Planctomycetes bacterium]|nr:hypothetical protein [Planctomycetota bacterium]
MIQPQMSVGQYSVFLSLQSLRQGMNWRYRDFAIENLALFQQNYRFIDTGATGEVAGFPTQEFRVERIDGSGSIHLLSVETVTGLVLAAREQDAEGQLISAMDFDSFALAPDLSAVAWHQRINDEQPLPVVGTLAAQIGFEPASPAPCPRGSSSWSAGGSWIPRTRAPGSRPPTATAWSASFSCTAGRSSATTASGQGSPKSRRTWWRSPSPPPGWWPGATCAASACSSWAKSPSRSSWGCCAPPWSSPRWATSSGAPGLCRASPGMSPGAAGRPGWARTGREVEFSGFPASGPRWVVFPVRFPADVRVTGPPHDSDADGQPFSGVLPELAPVPRAVDAQAQHADRGARGDRGQVRRSMDATGADVAKLGRIRKNLQDTLDVCVRARSALEQRGKISGALADDLSKVSPDLAQSARALHEAGAMSGPRKAARKRPGDWTSAAEAARLARQPRIRAADVTGCDLDQLARQLQG